MHFSKDYHLHWIPGRANILCENLKFIYFQFWCGFCNSFSMLFLEAPASCGKKNWNNFYCIVLLFVWAQKLSQIFKILFQTGNINIFEIHGVFFSRSVQLKSSFLMKKKQQWNLRDTLVEKLSKFNVGKY